MATWAALGLAFIAAGHRCTPRGLPTWRRVLPRRWRPTRRWSPPRRGLVPGRPVPTRRRALPRRWRPPRRRRPTRRRLTSGWPLPARWRARLGLAAQPALSLARVVGSSAWPWRARRSSPPWWWTLWRPAHGRRTKWTRSSCPELGSSAVARPHYDERGDQHDHEPYEQSSLRAGGSRLLRGDLGRQAGIGQPWRSWPQQRFQVRRAPDHGANVLDGELEHVEAVRQVLPDDICCCPFLGRGAFWGL